jgi:hypothetical protein
MTGPDHFREAERWLFKAQNPAAQGSAETVQSCAAIAQVHGILSLAAATALNQDGTGMLRADRQAWHSAAGAADRAPGPPRPVPPSAP